MLTKLWNLLDGYKSYLTAFLAVVYVVLGVFYFHTMNVQQAFTWLFGAAGLVSVKSALAKVEKASSE